jgi:hypothetical protein
LRRSALLAGTCGPGSFVRLESDGQAGEQLQIGVHRAGQLGKARPVGQRRQHQQGVTAADPAIQRHHLIVAEIAARRHGHDEQIPGRGQVVTALQRAEALAQ